jgi:hypothetical protein
MAGLYKQILVAMTPEQVKAVQDMTIAQTDLQEIMQKYGVQMRGGSSGQNRQAVRTPSANNDSNGRNFQDGPGGGFQGGPMGGGMPPEMGSRGSGSQNSVQATPQVGAARQSFRGGLNLLLSDAVIQLLEQKAGS